MQNGTPVTAGSKTANGANLFSILALGAGTPLPLVRLCRESICNLCGRPRLALQCAAVGQSAATSRIVKHVSRCAILVTVETYFRTATLLRACSSAGFTHKLINYSRSCSRADLPTRLSTA